MKNFLSAVAAAVMLLSCSACGNNQSALAETSETASSAALSSSEEQISETTVISAEQTTTAKTDSVNEDTTVQSTESVILHSVGPYNANRNKQRRPEQKTCSHGPVFVDNQLRTSGDGRFFVQEMISENAVHQHGCRREQRFDFRGVDKNRIGHDGACHQHDNQLLKLCDGAAVQRLTEAGGIVAEKLDFAAALADADEQR